MTANLRVVFLLAASLVTTPDEQKTTQEISRDARGEYLILREGAEIRTQQGVTWRAWYGEVVVAQSARDEWLWIHDRGGWLAKSDAIRLDVAVAEMTARIKETPTADAYHRRGLAFLGLRQPEQAIADFDQCVKLQPRSAAIFNSRGMAKRAMAQNDAALSDFSEAIRLDPKQAVALNNRGSLLLLMERYDEALTDLNAAIAINEEYAEALNNRGVLYKQVQKLTQAVTDFSAAIKRNPNYSTALTNRGGVWLDQNDYQRALQDFTQAVEIKPHDATAQNELAWVLATCDDPKIHNPELAVKHASAACRISEFKDANHLDTLAVAYAAAQNFPEAIEWLKRAIVVAPEAARPGLQSRLEFYSAKIPDIAK